jgi:hypothetical protein
MPTPTHTMELNGKQYNAITGQLLHTTPKSVDGFSVAAVSSRNNVTPKAMNVHREPLHHVAPHKAEKSQTLMRNTVKHPTMPFKRAVHVAPHTSTLVPKIQFDVMFKHSAQVVDGERLRRAHTIAKSGLVRRFAAGSHPSSRPTISYQSRTTPAPQVRIASMHEQPVATESPTTVDVFERALAAAAEPARKRSAYSPSKKRISGSQRLRQITSILASGLAVMLIIGFVAYNNAANIQLRLASARSGVNATLPAWQPSGFHLGTFAYGPGHLTVNYTNSAGQNFSIAQATSSLDSNTLLSDYVYPNNETYNTILAHGNTIYTYGNNDATWVNGGIWYKLTTHGSLSTSQLINIATSM